VCLILRFNGICRRLFDYLIRFLLIKKSRNQTNNGIRKMKITKQTVSRLTSLSQTKVDASRISSDDLNQKKLIKEIKLEIDKRVKTKKDFTIAIID